MRISSKIQEDDLQKYQNSVQGKGEEKDIILHFSHYWSLYRNLRSVMLPLVKFSLYMNQNYSYLISSDQANSGSLKAFVENSEDYRLEELYRELVDSSLSNNNGLQHLYELYKT